MVRSGAYDRKGSSSQSMANGSCDVRSAKRWSATERDSACNLCGTAQGGGWWVVGGLVVGGGWVVVAAAPVQRPQSHSKPHGTKVSLPPWAKERR